MRSKLAVLVLCLIGLYLMAFVYVVVSVFSYK